MRKKYDTNKLRPCFRHPVFGRMLLALSLLMSPFIFLAVIIVENRREYIRDIKEGFVVLVSPWESKSKKDNK